jgi:hypothetical protein
MTHTLRGADRAAHFKILAIATTGAIAAALVGMNAGVSGSDTTADVAELSELRTLAPDRTLKSDEMPAPPAPDDEWSHLTSYIGNAGRDAYAALMASALSKPEYNSGWSIHELDHWANA